MTTRYQQQDEEQPIGSRAPHKPNRTRWGIRYHCPMTVLDPSSQNWMGNKTLQELEDACQEEKQWLVDNDDTMVQWKFDQPPTHRRRGKTPTAIRRYEIQDRLRKRKARRRMRGLHPRITFYETGRTPRSVRALARNLIREDDEDVDDDEDEYEPDSDEDSLFGPDPPLPPTRSMEPPFALRPPSESHPWHGRSDKTKYTLDQLGRVVAPGDEVEVLKGKHKGKLGTVEYITHGGFLCIDHFYQRAPFPLDQDNFMLRGKDFVCTTDESYMRCAETTLNYPLLREVLREREAARERAVARELGLGSYFKVKSCNVLQGPYIHTLNPRERRWRELRFGKTYGEFFRYLWTDFLPATDVHDNILEYLGDLYGHDGDGWGLFT